MSLAQLGALLSVWFAAISSPGPDTVQLARLATQSRRTSVLGALGIMTGNTLWICLSLAGLSAVLAARPSFTHALEIIGGLVLCWMGVQAFRGGLATRRSVSNKVVQQGDGSCGDMPSGDKSSGARPSGARPSGDVLPMGAAQSADNPTTPTLSDGQAYRLGIITNLSNPKAIIFFGAVFAQFLTPDMGAGWTVALALILIGTGLAWFVGFAAAARFIAAPLARHAATIDMVAGAIFFLVGASLVTTGALASAGI